MGGINIREEEMVKGVVVRNFLGDKLKFIGVFGENIKFKQLSGDPYDDRNYDINGLISFGYDPSYDWWLFFGEDNIRFGR